MPFSASSKSRSVYDASSMGSSSASLLIPQEKKQASASSQKDYSAALGALSSQYGHSSSLASSQPPAEIHVSLPKGSSSQSQLQAQPASNVKKVRAKEFGAIQNKYGAIGHGGMTSII